MAWRDTLVGLREELAQVRADRRRRADEEQAELMKARDGMSRLSESLGVSGLLSEMNATLLNGAGEVETIVSWDADDDSGPDEDGRDYEQVLDDDEDDYDELITTVLSWDEDGEREIAVEVVLTEHGPALHVNGVDIRPDRDALEQALVEAFRDELEV